MAKKVVVIRVSEKTIRMVHMDNVSNNPVVYGCVRVPTPEGAVVDGMIVNPVEISKRIEKACLEKAIHTKDVIFTISSTKIASRETEIPAVQKAKMESVVMAKVPDLFPVDMDRYIFSYKVQGADYEDEEKGKLRSVRIFAAPSELVESYYKLADEAGLNVISVDSDVNSVFQIVSRQVKEKESVTMCIQINRDNTLVNIVTSDKLLLQRVIPYGVTVFTDAMVAEPVFQVEDYDHAFKVLSSQRVLMHNLNSVNPSGDFSTEKRIEVTANGEHLISNISRVMEYYNSRFRHNEINHVICVGSGCSIAGIHELLTNELGVEVKTPDSLEHVRFNKNVTVDAALLQYLNCFGAVFDSVNFVPKAMALREAKKGSLTGAIMIFAGLALVSVVLVGFSLIMLFSATDEHEITQSRLNALKPVEDQYNELMKTESEYKLAQKVEKYIDSNNNHFHELINELNKMVPKSFVIQSIQSTEDEVTINAKSEDKLSSLSLLQMQLNKIENIESVKIDAISETTQNTKGKREYTYGLTFKYKAKQYDEESSETDAGADGTTNTVGGDANE